MIPRTKVNYSFRDLFVAIRTKGTQQVWRKRLTSRLAEIVGYDKLLLTASGRGALYLLLRALPQSKVLVPAYTCKAVVEAALLAKKTLLFADCEERSFNMDPELARQKMGPDVIVIATHQFGIPCRIEHTMELARNAGAYVIEDVAAALGTRINGHLAGTFGDAAIFSFDSTKLINVPLKAGFIAIRSQKIFEDCARIHRDETAEMPLVYKWKCLMLGAILVALANHCLYRVFHTLVFKLRGRFTEDSPEMAAVLGPFYLYRMAEWQAYIALRQLEQLDSLIADRREKYASYLQGLAPATSFILPPTDRLNTWACIRFPILVPGGKLNFYNKGCKAGIDFAFSFTYIAAPAEFERAHRIANQILDLPYYYYLSKKEQNRVIQVLKTIDKGGEEIG